MVKLGDCKHTNKYNPGFVWVGIDIGVEQQYSQVICSLCNVMKVRRGKIRSIGVKIKTFTKKEEKEIKKKRKDVKESMDLNVNPWSFT